MVTTETEAIEHLTQKGMGSARMAGAMRIFV